MLAPIFCNKKEEHRRRRRGSQRSALSGRGKFGRGKVFRRIGRVQEHNPYDHKMTASHRGHYWRMTPHVGETPRVRTW